MRWRGGGGWSKNERGGLDRGRSWGGRGRRGRSCCSAGALTRRAGQVGAPGGGPLGGPAVAAEEIAEADHRRDGGADPAHPAPLEAGLDDELVGTLDRPAADRIALGPEGGVASRNYTD